MQFTITSRAEMPNEEFAAEISRAAGDLYSLYFPKCPSPDCDGTVDKASKQKGYQLALCGNVQCRTRSSEKTKRRNYFLVSLGS